MEHAAPTEDTDRLSDLPEEIILHILSFLPTNIAAQTALISRLFRHVWKSSPYLSIDSFLFYLYHIKPSNLADLRNLQPKLPRLRIYPVAPVTTSEVYTLLDEAIARGLRHLSVDLSIYPLRHVSTWLAILPHILSLDSLLSLSLQNVPVLQQLPSSTLINLKQLRTLCIGICSIDGAQFDFVNLLVPQLHALENLHIMSSHYTTHFIDLKSVTLRKLKLDLDTHDLRIFAPSLEHFELKSRMYLDSSRWDCHMPVLRKAVIEFKSVHQNNVQDIFNMLNIVSHVRELHIDIRESWDQTDTFHALLLPGVDPPTFFNLKHFNIEICFHECNTEDLVILLQHTPVLESLKLVHKPPFTTNEKKEKLWISQLPRNAEGNYRHAYFEDLHIPGKKEELLGQIMGKKSSKRLKT